MNNVKNNDNFNRSAPSKGKRLRQKIRYGVAMVSASLASILVPSAWAGAPVAPLPQTQARDPIQEAMMMHNKKLQKETQEELNRHSAKGDKIEAEQGEAAREAYELQYQEDQQQRVQEKAEQLAALKNKLLDEGICPFSTCEGQRQVTLHTKGLDLGNVKGSVFNMERLYEEKTPAKSLKKRKMLHRRVIACIVQDMRNRGIDAIDYFSSHVEQTRQIMDLDVFKASALLKKYQLNLEEYGSITPPAAGETSVKEQMASAQSNKKLTRTEKKAAKAAAKLAEKAAAAASN